MTDPFDVSDIEPSHLSHGLLVAVLMSCDGSLVIPADVFQADALGGPDGSWHAVSMQAQADGTIRLSVRPRPDVDGPGIHIE